ncbi:hypothetical protein DF024_13025 [Burkholderia cenocepacia]|nr:hypothetical protein DF024_13025 [Burkholderia cenocepacia]
MTGPNVVPARRAFQRERAVELPCGKRFADHRVNLRPRIENACASRRRCRVVHRPGSTSLTRARSSFPRHPPEKTTVATCGTTVVVRDAAVTLWA